MHIGALGRARKRHARRVDTDRGRRRGMSMGLAAALIVALVPAASVAQLALDATPASAATVSVPAGQGVQAQMASETGWNGNTAAAPSTGDCVRYGSAPDATGTGSIGNTGGSGGTRAQAWSDGSTGWVTSGTTAYSAHGSGSGTCPTTLSLSSQSAIGFAPATITSFATGTIFNLGRMVHKNNPITASNEWFRGDMNVRFMGMDLSFNWRLDETPNNATPVSNPANNDVLDLLNQIGDQSFTAADGNRYTLVVLGFTAPQNGDTCAATPTGAGAVVNRFSTVEQATTYGCLYASVQQIRPLTITKVAQAPITAPASIPAFPFSSDSATAGTPWDADFSLTPTAIGAGGAVSRTQDYVVGQNVTIAEAAPTGSWAFTSLTCVDGQGRAMPVTNGRTITLSGDLSVTDSASAPIRCTYTNTYMPQAKLTLHKNVVSAGQQSPVASAYNWTLSATGTGVTTGQAVQGRGQTAQDDATANPAITGRTVMAGAYALAEASDGTRTGGYAQDGPWTCVLTGTPTPVAVSAGQVTLGDGQDVTCTVTNRFQTGSLAITKTVATTPTGGYTLGTALAFTARYSCVVGSGTPIVGTVQVRPSAAAGSAGAAAVVDDLPAGATCTVTEVNPPAGSSGLADTSWVWGDPVIGASVSIPVGGRATVNITNTAAQQTGMLHITKAIQPRDGVSAAGYTGGVDREFTVDYTCRIGGTVVRSGSATISVSGAASIAGVPATASCAVDDEDLARAPGDFADASFRWDGHSVTPAVTIPANGTATLGVTNFFTRDNGSLTIAKKVVGDGYRGSGADFTVGYDCGDVHGTVTIADGGRATVQVPAGVLCAVQEQAPAAALLDAGYVWGAPTYDGLTNGSVSVTAGGTAIVTVTNPNAIGYGRISVTKAIAHFADVVASGTTFSVTVACSAPAQEGAADYTETFRLTWPGDVTRTTSYLPIGTDCSVAETTAPTGSTGLPDPSYAWKPAPPTQSVVVPASLQPAATTVTNDIVRVLAPFSIDKSVVNRTSSALTAGYSGTWSCTFPGEDARTGTWTAPPSGGAATLQPGGASTQVLVGSECTVTEAAPQNPVAADGSYVWATQLPAATAVPASGAKATVVNTLTRSTGSFTVAKSVSGGDAGEAYRDAAFPFDWTCTPASGDLVSGTLEVRAGGSAAPVTEIPGGSTCTVSEATAPAAIAPFTWDGVRLSVSGAATSTAQDGRSITFTTSADGATVNVAVINTLSPKTVDVTVAKKVVDPEGGFTGGTDAIFPMALSCDGVAEPVRDVAAGGTTTWSDIPLGATCSVRELAVDGGLKDASFQWAAPAYSPETVTADEPGGSYRLTVTNTVTRVYGEVGLRKVVDDGGFAGVVDPATVYSGTWSCTYDGEIVGGEWTSTGSAAGTAATLTGPSDRILLGSTCTATEKAPGAPSDDPSFSWKTPVVAGITVGADAAANVVSVTNTIERRTGELTVAKRLSGATDGYAPARGFAGFPIGAVCTSPGVEGAMEHTVDVLPGAAPVALITGVPYGWTCVVNEAPVSGQLADDAHAWGAPAYTVDGSAASEVTVSGAHAVVVDNPIRELPAHWSLAKTSDPASGSTVLPGQTITYTLTAVNDSEATVAGATAVDDLSGVLTSAQLTGALDPALARTGDTLTWTLPTLKPGASATVQYSVVVDQDADDATIRNVVTPHGSGGECDPKGCTTTHRTPDAGGCLTGKCGHAISGEGPGDPTGGLPVTGGDVPYAILFAAVALIGIGLVFALLAWRRRRRA